ncbi:MAG: glycosyltransferase 2 family protein [Thermoleophilales bacterium]|nr:glycosyltransferase 2 family protein [Thermoleophilales bacterium]
MNPGRARATRYAPAVVSGLALSGVAWWASHQQLPVLPVGGEEVRLLAIGVTIYLLATLVRCERWHQLLVKTGVTSARLDAYGLVAVGYMANNTLVARAGDVLKVMLSAGCTSAGTARLAGLAVAERGFDALALGGLFVVSGLLSPRLGFAGSGAVLRDGAIGGVAVLVIVIAGVLARRTHIGLAVRRELVAAARSLRPLAGWRGIRLLAMSAVVWLLEAGVYLAIGRAVGVRVDLLTSVQIVALVNLIGLVPAAPANLGTFDAAVLFATHGLTSGSGGLAYVLMLRLVLFVPITLVGLVVLVTRHGGLHRLRTLRPVSSET